MDKFEVQREWHYTIVENHVLKSELSSQAKLVYVVLCMYASKVKECYPSLKTLCKDTSIKSPTTIKKAINELKDKGFLKIKQRFDENGAQTSNLYIINDYYLPLSQNDTPSYQEMTGGIPLNDSPPYHQMIAPLSPNDNELKPINNIQLNENQLTKVNKAKIKYAEFVSMTEEEYSKLTNQYGEEMTKKMIEVLDNYKGATGKRYKSDYRAILNWVVDKVQKEKGEKQNGLRNGSKEDTGGIKLKIPTREYKDYSEEELRKAGLI